MERGKVLKKYSMKYLNVEFNMILMGREQFAYTMYAVKVKCLQTHVLGKHNIDAKLMYTHRNL